MDFLSRRCALALLALVAASIVTTEVLLTRLLSVTTWYGLAFVVLSLAMLGLTRGSLAASEARAKGWPMAPWIAARMAAMSASLLVATAVTLCTPMTFAPDLTSLASVLLVAGLSAVPLVAGGAVVARLMAESDVPLPMLYAVDLAAAAVGALLPLALLGPFSAQDAMVLLAGIIAAGALWVAPKGRRTRAWALVAVAGLVTVVGRVPGLGLSIRYAKGTLRAADITPTYHRWNALSEVYLGPFTDVPLNFLWAPSPLTPAAGTLTAASAVIDGEAATPVYQYTEPAQLNVLRFDATTSAHALRPHGTACVIGVGGGRDLISALVYGHDQVLGAEINPAILGMLRAVSNRSPILLDPRVHVVNADGRAAFAHTREHCEVLQASLVDTWAATSAGAFAHTEATLYTREAWAVFLDRVAPRGVLTFSRWYEPTQASETSRLVALAVASLLDRGVAHPRDHIAILAAGTVATILLSPTAFSPDDLAALHDLETRLRFTLLFAPDRPPTDPLLNTLLDARTLDDLVRAGIPYGFDTSAPTDDRPLFFQLMAPRAWLHPLRAIRSARGTAGVLAGNATAMTELIVTLLSVTLLGAGLLGPTLIKAASTPPAPLPSARAGVYFGALGAGFMAAELALVQRMHVVLGHPTYALVVVLAGLLVATGGGSALSTVLVPSRRAVRVAALVAAGVLTVLPYAIIRPLARATMASGFAWRAGWTGATAALVGIVLGTLFPSGIRYVSRVRGAPVALAINGASSVLGSVAALTVSVWVGIPATFALAGLAYLVAAVCAPPEWPSVDDTPVPVKNSESPTIS